MGLVEQISLRFGLDPAGLNLLLGLLISFPVAQIYKQVLLKRKPSLFLANSYFAVTGLAIYYFCFGAHVVYPLLSILTSYLILSTFNRLNNQLAGAFVNGVFVFGYFLWCIIKFSTESYDVMFTTPQAVLTLRLIGLGVDVYDGKRSNRKEYVAHLDSLPSYLEFLGFSFNVMGQLVGPQFSFTDYRTFLEQKSLQSPEESLKTFGITSSLAVFYLTATVFLQSRVSSTHLLASEFMSLSLWKKLIGFVVVGKVIMLKYFGVYLLQMAISSLARFKPSVNLYQLGNVNVRRFETATSIHHLIESFNINTNAWAKYYIFKRLRFLGNKFLSSTITLTFLAVWHGYHLGYFVCFFLELIFVEAENRLKVRFRFFQEYIENMKNVALRSVCLVSFNIMKHLLTFLLLGYALVAFDLLLYSRSDPVYSSSYYLLHWLPFVVIITDLILPVKKKIQ